MNLLIVFLSTSLPLPPREDTQAHSDITSGWSNTKSTTTTTTSTNAATETTQKFFLTTTPRTSTSIRTTSSTTHDSKNYSRGDRRRQLTCNNRKDNTTKTTFVTTQGTSTTTTTPNPTTNRGKHSSPNERVHGPAVRRFILRSRKMLSWLLPLLVGGFSFKGLSTGACIQYWYLSLWLALGHYKLWCNLWYNIHNFI